MGFQSQTRSQSPGDASLNAPASQALQVSIADAKAIPWRPAWAVWSRAQDNRFQSQTRSQSPGDHVSHQHHRNTVLFQSQTRSQSPGDLDMLQSIVLIYSCFNRRREANPLATHPPKEGQPAKYEFQSQTRSQSPGDLLADLTSAGLIRVSIADAKPIPWRLHL